MPTEVHAVNSPTLSSAVLIQPEAPDIQDVSCVICLRTYDQVITMCPNNHKACSDCAHRWQITCLSKPGNPHCFCPVCKVDLKLQTKDEDLELHHIIRKFFPNDYYPRAYDRQCDLIKRQMDQIKALKHEVDELQKKQVEREKCVGDLQEQTALLARKASDFKRQLDRRNEQLDDSSGDRDEASRMIQSLRRAVVRLEDWVGPPRDSNGGNRTFTSPLLGSPSPAYLHPGSPTRILPSPSYSPTSPSYGPMSPDYGTDQANDEPPPDQVSPPSLEPGEISGPVLRGSAFAPIMFPRLRCRRRAQEQAAVARNVRPRNDSGH